MDKHKIHLSDRGIPLIYTGEHHDKPVLTVENYLKWYSFFLVHPDGTVTKVESGDVLEAANRDPEARWVDHIFSPRLYYRVAELLKADTCTETVEIIIGRWMREYDPSQEIGDSLHLYEPDPLPVVEKEVIKELRHFTTSLNGVFRAGLKFDQAVLDKAIEEFNKRDSRPGMFIAKDEPPFIRNSSSRIDPAMAAIQTSDLQMDLKTGILSARVAIMDTPEGRKLENILMHNAQDVSVLSFGMRALHNKEKGKIDLVSFDIIDSPP